MIKNKLLKNKMIKDLSRYLHALEAIDDIKIDIDCYQAYLPIDKKDQSSKDILGTIGVLNEMIKNVLESIDEVDGE